MTKYRFSIRTFFPKSLKNRSPERSWIYRLMRKLTVSRRIFGGFLFLVMMFAITVPFVLWNNHLLLERVKQVTNVDTKADRLLLLSSKRIESSRVNLMRFLQNLIPSVQESLTDVTQATQLLAEAEKLLTAQEQNVAVKQVIEMLTKYQSLIQQIGVQRGGGGGIESSRLGFTVLKTGSDIGFQIENIVEKNEARIADENRIADSRIRTNLRLLLIYAACALIVSLILAAFVGRSITVPISELKESAESFQIGHIDFALVITGTDELSLLALTFKKMAANLNQNKITLQDRADALEEELSQRRLAETELQRYQENLEELVKSRTSELSKTVEQMNVEISERRKTEEALKLVHENMAKSTEDLQNKLVEMNNARKAMLNILEDLNTAKKETEATMQQLNVLSQEQVAIFESVILGIAFIKDRIILRGNTKLGELFGRSLDEMVGQTTRIWYKNEEEYLGIGASTYEDLKRQAIHQREQELPRKDGSLFWCLFRVRAVDPQDISQGIVCTLEDITERKKAENELKERMEDLERFSNLTVDREERMIQLKEEINTLLGQMGQDKKYKIVE